MGTSSYPIVLTNLQTLPCLVIGGGAVAERKVAALLEASAKITVITPMSTATIRRWADDGRIRLLERVFAPDDVVDCALVIAATNNSQVNASIARTARASGVLVNVVDDPTLGSFITPATVRRGDLLVSVTTGGNSPVVASLVRRTLERTLGDEYSMLLDLLANLRDDLRDELPSSARAALLRALATDEMLEWLRTGQQERVSTFVTEQLLLVQGVATPVMPSACQPVEVGTVSLVGAGPGDPDLLTLKGMHLLNRADAVVYDDLTDEGLLAHCAPGTERYAMGKRSSKGSTPQHEIDDLLVSLARQGKHVVRLKGGDPFMFGHGDEEARALEAMGIPWEVVPGVSAGYAAPANAGISLTHREWSSSVAFVSGHADPILQPRVVDWHGIATSADTIVIFMGVRHLRSIAQQIIAGGRDPSTPVAVIEYATLARQRTLIATLATIGEAAARARVTAPAITVIGEVVGARLPINLGDLRVEPEIKAPFVSWGDHI